MKKRMLLLRNVSLGAMAVTVIVRFASGLLEIPLPDAAVRLVGVVQLVCLAVFGFSAIRYRRM